MFIVCLHIRYVRGSRISDTLNENVLILGLIQYICLWSPAIGLMTAQSTLQISKQPEYDGIYEFDSLIAALKNMSKMA